VPIDVVAAAIVRHGRVLAARRVRPYDVAGGWELPGGKVDSGETPEEALRREIREELGCEIKLVRRLDGTASSKPGYELTAYLVQLTSGEPTPNEHDALRWLAPEEIDEVVWLPADQPFLAQLGELLLDGEQLPGGNVGGAVRIGSTVRRPTGAWTPAVHALLDHLARTGLTGTPRVLGTDSRGREVLTYLPGRVLAPDDGTVSDHLLADAMRWLRRYHEKVRTFRHPGPWRNASGGVPTAVSEGEIICHHDFGTYNVASGSSADGDVVMGVFDWDMAGPGRPIEDVAFAAWSWVPLYRTMPVEYVARRLVLLASSYAGGCTPSGVLGAVMQRMDRSVRVIRAGQDAGDPGMLQLATRGEPDRTERALATLATRLPEIAAALPT
jgi:8-oxo-dGTP diphosphatase